MCAGGCHDLGLLFEVYERQPGAEGEISDIDLVSPKPRDLRPVASRARGLLSGTRPWPVQSLSRGRPITSQRVPMFQNYSARIDTVS